MRIFQPNANIVLGPNYPALMAYLPNGLPYLFRSQFLTTVSAPITNPYAAEVGGNWTTTDTATKLFTLLGRLRGGSQTSTPAWGNEQLVAPSIARAIGRTYWALVTLEDQSADIAFGLGTSSPSGDPRTNGFGFLNESNNPDIITPGVKVETDKSGKRVKSMQYLLGVTLNDMGASVLISTFGTDTAGSFSSTDKVDIPAYPLFRNIWTDYADTTTPLYPYISYLDDIGPYPNSHAVEDVRIIDVKTWNTADFLASFTDRFTRADSNTTVGAGYTAISGVWGISSNQAYNVSGSGFRTVYNPNTNNSGDGIYIWKVTLSGTATDSFRLTLRHNNSTGDMIVLNSNGSTGAIALQKWVANNFSANISASPNFTLPTTLTANSTHVFTLMAKGNNYLLYQNGLVCNGGAWITDAGNNFLTANGIGFGVANSNPTVFRFDNIAVFPHYGTLPAEMQQGATPYIAVPGATLAQDTFTDTNATHLNAHTAEAGGAWTERFGSWTISSNAATVATVSGENYATQNVGSANADASVTVQIPTGLDNTKAIRAGIFFRYVDANGWLAVRLFKDPSQIGNDEVELIETIGGTSNVIHKLTLGTFYAASTNYTLEVQAKNDLVQIFLTGIPILTYYTASGSPLGTNWGLYKNNVDTSGSTFDGWLVKQL